MPPQLAPWAALLDLTGLDDDLALAVRHFLSRNRQLAEPARTRLGLALAREVSAVHHAAPAAERSRLGLPGGRAGRAAPARRAPAGRRPRRRRQ